MQIALVLNMIFKRSPQFNYLCNWEKNIIHGVANNERKPTMNINVIPERSASFVFSFFSFVALTEA